MRTENTTMTVTLTPELMDKLAALFADSTAASMGEELQRAVDFGITNRFYRKNYNAVKNQERKSLGLVNQELQKRLEALEALLGEKKEEEEV